MDADLYSSTLFALTSMAPFLREGDIIPFDEFNIPNHEFAAWSDFVRSYYIQYEVTRRGEQFLPGSDAADEITSVAGI